MYVPHAVDLYSGANTDLIWSLWELEDTVLAIIWQLTVYSVNGEYRLQEPSETNSLDNHLKGL